MFNLYYFFPRKNSKSSNHSQAPKFHFRVPFFHTRNFPHSTALSTQKKYWTKFLLIFVTLWNVIGELSCVLSLLTPNKNHPTIIQIQFYNFFSSLYWSVRNLPIEKGEQKILCYRFANWNISFLHMWHHWESSWEWKKGKNREESRKEIDLRFSPIIFISFACFLFLNFHISSESSGNLDVEFFLCSFLLLLEWTLLVSSETRGWKMEKVAKSQ